MCSFLSKNSEKEPVKDRNLRRLVLISVDNGEWWIRMSVCP